MSSNSPRLLVVGHPLLDLIVLDGASLVEKYKLNSNDARLAGPEHVPMYVVPKSILHTFNHGNQK